VGEAHIIKLPTNYYYICFRICKKIQRFTLSVLRDNNSERGTTFECRLEHNSELVTIIDSVRKFDITRYYGFEMHHFEETKAFNIALAYANDGFLLGLKWLCTENNFVSDIYAIWGVSLYAARRGHLDILKWLKDEKEFKYWKIGELMKYAIIGGSIPVFLFVLDIKKNNLYNSKIKYLIFINKIVNNNNYEIRNGDIESNYFAYSLIGNNLNMVEYIFEQGYEAKMNYFYYLLGQLNNGSDKNITIKDMLDEKIIIFLKGKGLNVE
jgi:hypothetical protein